MRHSWLRKRAPWQRGGLRTWLLLLALAVPNRSPAMMLWGLPLLAAGIALQCYAKGCLRQDRAVATGGPYRFVRHPFYAATLLVDEAIALFSGFWPLAVLLLPWWCAVYLPIMRREERHLAQVFPEVYPKYARRVPALIPPRRPLPRGADGFSWRNPNIVADTVIPRAVRLLSYPLMLLLWGEIRQHGLSAFANAGSPQALGAIAAASLYCISWQLSRHLRSRRRILPAALGKPEARLACVLGFILAAGLTTRGETESDVFLGTAGVVAIAASCALYLWRTNLRLEAEAAALVGAALLCELLWLAAVPVLLYLPLILDRRIAASTAAGASSPRPLFALADVYAVAMVGGIIAACAKEMLLA